MGKRSNYERKPRDYYQTPLAAVKPLIPHLPTSFTFAEPCAGDGRLITHIESLSDSACGWASDIEPQGDDIFEMDIFDIAADDLSDCDLIITNPPWDRTPKSDYLLHRIITHCSGIKPTWLLFDADWPHTLQSSEYIRHCVKMVSVGRVKWIEDSAGVGKDNCAWYLFDANHMGRTEFVGR